MVDSLSLDSYKSGLPGGGLPIDEDIMFADHAGNHKPRIEKKQRKLLDKVDCLNGILEDGEDIKMLTVAVSPTSLMEQLTTGVIFLYIKRSILVFTDRRVLHIPTTSSYDYRGSIAELRYGDLASIEQRGSKLKVAYRSGAKEVFLAIRGSERKKIRALLASLDLNTASGKGNDRVHLCPDCSTTLENDRYDCPGCQKEFKSRKTAVSRSLWLPGGGYFYTGHPFLGIIDATVEAFFILLIVFSLLPSETSPDGEPAAAIVFAILLLIEKAITVYHANHFVKEYLPAEPIKIKRSPLRMAAGAVGAVLLVGFLGLAILGTLSDVGYTPSDRVLAADSIPARHMDELRQSGMLDDGEQVEQFYSEGLVSVLEGGSILTNRRVIAYQQNDEGLIDYFYLMHDEIVDVTLSQQGDTLNYSVYTVSGEGEDNWITLWLPHEFGDGERFADAVRAKITR